MKVVILKSYKNHDLYNIDNVWDFNSNLETKEINEEEFEELKRAIDYYNTNDEYIYQLNVSVIVNDEFNELMRDYHKYEEVESSRKEMERVAYEESLKEDREKRKKKKKQLL